MSDTENKNCLLKRWHLSVEKQELNLYLSCCGSNGVTHNLKVWLVCDLWMFLKTLQMLWMLCTLLIEAKD